jgi:hypothetical protein
VRYMTQSESRKAGVDSWLVGAAIAFAILLIPFLISYRGDRFTLISGLWQLIMTPNSNSLSLLGFGTWTYTNLMILVLPQFLFVYQMMRLYEGKTTGPRAFVAWFLGVVIHLVTFVMNSLRLLWDPNWPYAFGPVLFPGSLLVAVLLLRFYPPPRETIPWKETKPWWKRA